MSDDNSEVELMDEDKTTNKEAVIDNTLTETTDIYNKTDTDAVKGKSGTIKKNKITLYQKLRIVFKIGFVVFAALFINEVFLQPLRINKSIEIANELYKNTKDDMVELTPTNVITTIGKQESTEGKQASTDAIEQDPENDSKVENKSGNDLTRDRKGRLLQFQPLLNLNEDVKGWISIPDSNIDYVVMQSGKDDPEYYLSRDIEKQELKAGSLFLDKKCSVETSSQNLTIHGHNMTSTDNMFHYLINFKELDYYKARPIITFDTIYQTGQWKIFALLITNGSNTKEPLFNYTKADFSSSSDFLNFVYQLRIRSIYNIDTVDMNENDQLLTLSTCSYEVKNYRTVIIARRVRDGEEATVEVDSVVLNPNTLYPASYYYRYGGKAPELADTFEEALENGAINWYTPVETIASE